MHASVQRGRASKLRADALALAPVGSEQCEPTARMLARAFRDNPLNVAVIDSAEPARRQRANLHGMRASLESALRDGETLAASSGGRVLAALLAVPPGAYPLPVPGLLRQALCVFGQGWRVATRWGEVFDVLRRHHPVEPHWYLGTLGVEPELQRRGLGDALLRAWLEQVDRRPAPAYLETDRAENLPFYAHAGFEELGRIEVLGASIWRMQRAAVGEGAISDGPRAQ
jgi:ribosomal protein S18 acetylase RimI-like enzyme